MRVFGYLLVVLGGVLVLAQMSPASSRSRFEGMGARSKMSSRGSIGSRGRARDSRKTGARGSLSGKSSRFSKGKGSRFSQGKGSRFSKGKGSRFSNGKSSRFSKGKSSRFSQGKGSRFSQGKGSRFSQGKGSRFSKGKGSRFSQGKGSRFSQGKGFNASFNTSSTSGTTGGSTSGSSGSQTAASTYTGGASKPKANPSDDEPNVCRKKKCKKLCVSNIDDLRKSKSFEDDYSSAEEKMTLINETEWLAKIAKMGREERPGGMVDPLVALATEFPKRYAGKCTVGTPGKKNSLLDCGIVFRDYEDRLLLPGVIPGLAKAAMMAKKQGYAIKVVSTYRSPREQMGKVCYRFGMCGKGDRPSCDDEVGCGGDEGLGCPRLRGSGHVDGYGADLCLVDPKNPDDGLTECTGNWKSCTKNLEHVNKKTDEGRYHRILDQVMFAAGWWKLCGELWHFEYSRGRVNSCRVGPDNYEFNCSGKKGTFELLDDVTPPKNEVPGCFKGTPCDER